MTESGGVEGKMVVGPAVMHFFGGTAKKTGNQVGRDEDFP